MSDQSTDLVAEYHQAVLAYQQPVATVERIRAAAAGLVAALDQEPWHTFLVLSDGSIQARNEDEDEEGRPPRLLGVSLAAWPNRQEIQESLDRCKRQWHLLREAWERVPEPRRSGLEDPQTLGRPGASRQGARPR